MVSPRGLKLQRTREVRREKSMEVRNVSEEKRTVSLAPASGFQGDQFTFNTQP